MVRRGIGDGDDGGSLESPRAPYGAGGPNNNFFGDARVVTRRYSVVGYLTGRTGDLFLKAESVTAKITLLCDVPTGDASFSRPRDEVPFLVECEGDPFNRRTRSKPNPHRERVDY